MTENPFSPPTESTSSVAMSNVDNVQRSLLVIARSTFLAWEKLRIAYVSILIVITVLLVLLVGPAGFLNRRLLLMTVEGAIVANVAYLAGPTIETYVKWLGYDRPWPRWVMFIGGTLLTIILAVGVLATELLPDQE